MKNSRVFSIWLPLKKTTYSVVLVTLCFFCTTAKCFAQEKDSILQKQISLSRQFTTVYKALNQISDSTGILFAYDSRIVKSDRRIRIDKTKRSLSQTLIQILNDSTLKFELIDQHILIYRDSAVSSLKRTLQPTDSLKNFTVKGRVLDSETQTPIAYATVGVPDYALGNVSNLDGVFTLKIPMFLKDSTLKISHIGYKPKSISISILKKEPVDIYLTTDYISIQEVIIRNIDPLSLLKEALSKVDKNYSSQPTYLNSFYREGVVKNNKYQNYSEAIFSIYKPPYSSRFTNEQVKLLKSRKTQNINASDTLSIKLRGGINSILQLDIIKNLPSFLEHEYWKYFNYTRKDIVSYQDKIAYEITFEQKEHITKPLFKGKLYIDTETFAIVGAKFEVNPRYISSVTSQYVYKTNWRFRIKPVSIRYSVSYSQTNNKYHLSHIRGDLHFKYRKRRTLFYNPFHTFFELAVSQVSTSDVNKFHRKETASTSTVFFDERLEYDPEFWRDFNIILPEGNVKEALEQIDAKIENIVIEEDDTK